MVKIKIPLLADNLAKADSESLWAEPQSDGYFLLKNVPFYAKGVSFDDLVSAEKLGEDLLFERVVRHNGHSTYRIYAAQGRSVPEVLSVLEQLRQMHCDIEPATDKLVSIDVLPQADIGKVYAILTDAERTGVIDFQEGHCGHGLRA